jgi:type I restriction enzyme S subunit
VDGPFGSNLKSSHYAEHGPRVVRLQNIGDGVFRDEHAHISDEHFTQLRKHEVLPGDVVVASLGEEAPRACVIPDWLGPALVKADCIRVRPRDAMAPAFLMWMLNSPPVREQAASRIKGVGRPRLGLGGIRELMVPVPPLAEQRRIVAAIEEQLSRLDAAMDNGRAALKRIGSIYEAIFDGAADRDWPRRALGSLLREPLRNGVSARASPTGSVRIVTLSAVTQDAFIEANSKLADVDAHRVRDLWLEPGDVLIERSNTAELVGTAALYDGPGQWAIFPDLLIRVRTTDELRPDFLALVLRTRASRRYFRGAAKGLSGSMPKIGQDDIRELLVPVPPRAEQDAAVAQAERLLGLTAALSEAVSGALTRAQRLRRSILAAAYRGDLVPQDPNEEPASVLLERIAAERAAMLKRQRKRREKATV